MKTIVLSAGHGGRDPGASYNGVREKDVNLAVTLACRDYLNDNYTGHTLVLPRATDVWVSLPDRRELTRKVNADLYVSIHHNAYNIPSANGFSTYVHSGPLFGVTLRYREILHKTVYDYVKTLGIRDRGMKRGDHWVTREMPAPTVLMEYMFLSNVREAGIARTPAVQQNLGKYTALGVAEALNLPRKAAPTPPPPQTDVWYRVLAGSWRNRAYAEAAVARLKGLGYDAFIEVRHDE